MGRKRPVPVFFCCILVGIYSGVLAVATMSGQVIVRTKLPQALVTLTPPYGMTTFITARILDMPMLRLVKAMLPWMLALFFFALIVAFFPQIVMWLPHLMGYVKKFKQSESRKNIPRGVGLKRQMLRGISYFSFGLHLLGGGDADDAEGDGEDAAHGVRQQEAGFQHSGLRALDAADGVEPVEACGSFPDRSPLCEC